MVNSEPIRILNALANQNRLNILTCLLSGKKNVSELMESTGLSQSTVSHCLYRLTSTGLIDSVAQSRFRYYAICAPVVPKLLGVLDAHVRT